MKKKISLNKKVKEIVHCKSILSKTCGFMFSTPQNKALVFYFKKNSRVSIHNFFVFYPLDIYWLDQNKQITAIKKRFLPFSLAKAKNAMYVIEAKAGLMNFQIGDTIEF